eukprot:CAMPEP_0179008088 /NCGR_PEP_ID=MMETSP0795-20121207/15515_1 /TAXON_ID=88552 /ORGANISM="Amoebophrya sp., Strain Ameob2" /LENGTH=35 /DNA_ID= /DNA_START= /DNA_END= /DNA_ORIENTATION=
MKLSVRSAEHGWALKVALLFQQPALTRLDDFSSSS